MNIPANIQNLSNAFSALGLKSSIGPVKRASGDKGYVVHVGEHVDEYYDGNGKLCDELGCQALISFSFDSECKLKDVESIRSIMFIDEIEAENERKLKAHGVEGAENVKYRTLQ